MNYKGTLKNSLFRINQIFGIEERWEAVSERGKESNRYIARHLPSKILILEKIGIKEINKENIEFHLGKLAPIEHNRWSAEKIMAGFNYGELPLHDKKNKKHFKKYSKNRRSTQKI